MKDSFNDHGGDLGSDGNEIKDMTTGNVYRLRTLWSIAIKTVKQLILNSLKAIACFSARNPTLTIAFIVICSTCIFTLGCFTNYRVEASNQELFTPIGSLTSIHEDWIKNESGYAEVPQGTSITVHADGKNVLSVEGVSHIFEILNNVTAMDQYHQLCGSNNKDDCRKSSVTTFWVDDVSSLGDDDEEAIRIMSGMTYPSGVPVYRPHIFGNSEPSLSNNEDYSEEEIILESAQQYYLTFSYPAGPKADEFEEEVSDVLSRIRKEWENDGSEWRLEYFLLSTSMEMEMKRAIDNDTGLIGFAFLMMFMLCALYFTKRDLVQSQSMLGIGAVLCIFFSLIAAFGFFFCIGVPFTSMAQIIPFILAGIGLDDAFIITGSFFRTDPDMDVVNRVSKTIDEIGLSIFLSTMSTFLAFMLSSTTRIPVMRWFCFYAALCVLVDFIFQISFFISYLVLEQRRIKANRYQILCCFHSLHSVNDPKKTSEEKVNNDTPTARGQSEIPEVTSSPKEKLIDSYIDILFRPVTKGLVILVFAGILILGSLSAAKMKQYFDFTMVVPADSFVADYFHSNELYGSKDATSFNIHVYFRYIDVSLEENRRLIKSYVDDLVDECTFITEHPAHFWVNDFETFVTSDNIENLNFNAQIRMFLSTLPFSTIYGSTFAWNEAGNITSKTEIGFNPDLDRSDVMDQIQAFAEVREVSRKSPLNKRESELSVFTYADFYYSWEFSSIVIEELLYTSIYALISVFVLSFIFIPHYSGAFFVTVTVSMMFIELVGLLQVCGVFINSVTTIMLVMAIGLSVDFVMHIVHAYFETEAGTREGKVYIAMMTMGSSLLIAGCSTFFGTLLLAFGSSEMCYNFFVTFVGIVALGLSHSLILIPVILSLIGPRCNPKRPKFHAKLNIADSKCNRFFPNN